MIKAQYSVEFILVFAFSLAIILPIIGLMHSEYWENKQSLDESQAKQVLDELSIAIQNTYYAGSPSRTTLDLYFPRGISGITTQSTITPTGVKSELIFVITRKSESGDIISTFPFNISTDLKPSEGRRRILVKAENKDLIDYVNITEFVG